MISFVLAATSAVFLLPCEYHIDCSGWPGGAVNEFDVRITARDGTVFTTSVLAAPEATAEGVRDVLWVTLKDSWRGRTVGKGIIVLEGSKDSPVRLVEFKSKDWKPDARWAPLLPEKR